MPSDMRFTRAQKWDLVRMSGAALVSTVFFSIPLFVERPAVARADIPQPAKAEVAPQVSVVVSESIVKVSTPVLVSTAGTTPVPMQPAVRRATPRPAQAPQRAALAPTAIKPLAKRLGRLLVGSGRYEVRPFPAPGTSGS